MAAEQRKALEQLMGAEAMLGAGVVSKKATITDRNVCRPYLLGLCPHELFTNTKEDRGACPNVHSPALKAEYEAADEQKKEQWGFDWDVMNAIRQDIINVEAKVAENEKRLEKTPEETRKTATLLEDIQRLEENIDTSYAEIRVMLEVRAVNMATVEFWKVRVMLYELENKREELRLAQDSAGPSGHQKLQVCDVCGAYLSRLDNNRRLADHFYGKMHIGYRQLRAGFASLQAKTAGRRPPARLYHEDTAPTGPRDRDFGGPRRGGWRGGRGRRY